MIRSRRFWGPTPSTKLQSRQYLFLMGCLGLFFSLLVVGCKDEKPQKKKTKKSLKKTKEEKKEPLAPHAWGFDTPRAALEKVKESALKVELDTLINLVDPRADMRLEDLRLLAMTQGAWSPSDPTSALYESVHELSDDTVIEELAKRTQAKELHRRIAKRKKLITRVIRTLLTERSTKPSNCTVKILKRLAMSEFLVRDEWSIPARRVGTRLMEPWTQVALGRLHCAHRRPEFTLLREAATGKWVVAQVQNTLPRRYAWRFMSPPGENPFAGGGNAAKSHHELYAQTVRCLDTGKASCLGPFIHLSHFTTMQTTELLLLLSQQARAKAIKNLKGAGFVGQEVSGVFLWRHFLFWTRYLGVDWKKCTKKVVGLDERSDTKKRYLAAWKGQKPPKQTLQFLRDVTSLRTALYRCPRSLELTLTGARSKKRKGWVLVDINVSKTSKSPQKNPIPPPK